MNTILKNVKLGAPDQIIGGECQNCDLSVSIMEKCINLSLSDGDTKCTRDGAFITATRLLNQIQEEQERKESTGFTGELEGVNVEYSDTSFEDGKGDNTQLYLKKNGETIDPHKVYWSVSEIIESDDGVTINVSKEGKVTSDGYCKVHIKAVDWNNVENQQIVYVTLYNPNGGTYTIE